MQGSLPPEAQEKLEELQNLQETAQNVSEQKQSSETALNEAQTALDTLEDVDADSKMYREVGELLIETDYEAAQEDLEEKVESLEVRVEKLTKQESRVQVAYLQLGELNDAGGLSPKTMFLATFALCGFANFSSIGIQIGGIGALASERRSDLATLGFKAMIGGTIASLLTASIAGMFFFLS